MPFAVLQQLMKHPLTDAGCESVNPIAEVRAGFTDLKATLVVQQVLHAVAVGQHSLTAEIRALVARLDALIDRRGDGGRTA